MPPAPRLYFDLVDPLSYLVERELGSLETGALVERVPFELRPPPRPLVLIDDDTLAERWAAARSLAARAGLALSPPRLVPWSRKAHELVALAAAHGVADLVRRAAFDAYMLGGQDIGRVDVLVEIAREAGLDRTEAKAVLDVDRHEEDVLAARRRATADRVEDAPVLVGRSGRLEGFHNREALRTFLADS